MMMTLIFAIDVRGNHLFFDVSWRHILVDLALHGHVTLGVKGTISWYDNGHPTTSKSRQSDSWIIKLLVKATRIASIVLVEFLSIIRLVAISKLFVIYPWIVYPLVHKPLAMENPTFIAGFVRFPHKISKLSRCQCWCENLGRPPHRSASAVPHWLNNHFRVHCHGHILANA